MRVYDDKILKSVFITLLGFFLTLQYLTQSAFFDQNPSMKANLKHYYLMIVIVIVFLCLPYIIQSTKTIIFTVIMSVFVILMFHYQSYSDFGVSLLAIYFAVLVDYKNIILTDLISRLISLSFIFMTYILGYTHDVMDSRYGMRYAIGFLNPNGLSVFILILALEIIWLIRKKSWKVVILVFVSYLLFFITKSRTDLYALILVLPFIFKLNTSKSFIKNKVLSFTIVLFPIVLAFISIYFSMNYDPVAHPFEYDLNLIFSNRLYLSKFYFNQFPITLFGNSLTNLINGALDSGYVSLLIRGGIISLFLYLILVTLTINKYIRSSDNVIKFFVLILIVYSIIGITELSLYQINLGLFLIAGLLINTPIREKGKSIKKVR